MIEKSTNTAFDSLWMSFSLHSHLSCTFSSPGWRLNFQMAGLLIYEGNAIWPCLRFWFREKRLQEANQGSTAHNFPVALAQDVFSGKMKVPTWSKQGYFWKWFITFHRFRPEMLIWYFSHYSRQWEVNWIEVMYGEKPFIKNRIDVWTATKNIGLKNVSQNPGLLTVLNIYLYSE